MALPAALAAGAAPPAARPPPARCGAACGPGCGLAAPRGPAPGLLAGGPAAPRGAPGAAPAATPAAVPALRLLAGGAALASCLGRRRGARAPRAGRAGRAAAAVAEVAAGSVETSSRERRAERARALAGPAVVVTGGSQGVGRATAVAFARLGYHVVVAARSEEALQSAEAAVRRELKPGMEAMAVKCDITSEADVIALRDAVAGRFSGLRAVVCNAGVCMTGDFLSHSMQDYEMQMRVNFLGHVATAQAFMPELLRLARRGSRGSPKPALCFVNSFGGRMPLPNMSAYCASKYALQGFVDTLRIEADPKGVHVATVHPGVVRSSFRERAQWRGTAGSSAQSNMNRMLDGDGPMSAGTQSPEEVAAEIVEAVTSSKNETVVGGLFKGLLGATSIAKGLGIA